MVCSSASKWVFTEHNGLAQGAKTLEVIPAAHVASCWGFSVPAAEKSNVSIVLRPAESWGHTPHKAAYSTGFAQKSER